MTWNGGSIRSPRNVAFRPIFALTRSREWGIMRLETLRDVAYCNVEGGSMSTRTMLITAAIALAAVAVASRVSALGKLVFGAPAGV